MTSCTGLRPNTEDPLLSRLYYLSIVRVCRTVVPFIHYNNTCSRRARCPVTYFLYRYFVTLLAFLLIYCTMYGMLSVYKPLKFCSPANSRNIRSSTGTWLVPLNASLYCTLYSTYLITPWCRVLLEKLTGLQLVQKFPAFHGTRRFITAPTSVRHLSLSWASLIQSI